MSSSKFVTDKKIIKLSSYQGNAFYIISVAKDISDREGMDTNKIIDEMTSSDYQHLLKVFVRYFNQYAILTP